MKGPPYSSILGQVQDYTVFLLHFTCRSRTKLLYSVQRSTGPLKFLSTIADPDRGPFLLQISRLPRPSLHNRPRSMAERV